MKLHLSVSASDEPKVYRVGTRVAVWSQKNEWYIGTVKKTTSRSHIVRFDAGEDKTLKLDVFKIVPVRMLGSQPSPVTDAVVSQIRTDLVKQRVKKENEELEPLKDAVRSLIRAWCEPRGYKARTMGKKFIMQKPGDYTMIVYVGPETTSLHALPVGANEEADDLVSRKVPTTSFTKRTLTSFYDSIQKSTSAAFDFFNLLCQHAVEGLELRPSSEEGVKGVYQFEKHGLKGNVFERTKQVHDQTLPVLCLSLIEISQEDALDLVESFSETIKAACEAEDIQVVTSKWPEVKGRKATLAVAKGYLYIIYTEQP